MNITEFILRLALLLLPGIVAVKVYRKLKGRTTKKDWEDFIDILLFSIISYLIYAIMSYSSYIVFYKKKQKGYMPISIIETIYNNSIPINWQEIFWATVIGFILAFFASYIYKKKIINRLGQLIKATNRYGDEDIWGFFHNVPNIEWVVVRDHKVNLYYFCYIKAFSETKERRELLLGDVTVYDENGRKCYDTDAMYISRNCYDLTIEIPRIHENLPNQNKGELGNES